MRRQGAPAAMPVQVWDKIHTLDQHTTYLNGVCACGMLIQKQDLCTQQPILVRDQAFTLTSSTIESRISHSSPCAFAATTSA